MCAKRDDGFPGGAPRGYDWVNTGTPPKRGPGGSPFQMPTRLADGLGLESDLGHPDESG